MSQHAVFILLAEFDIIRGTTLEHQYPAPTGANEQTLAELMLPEGAQNRAEDWTVFYLNSVPKLRVIDPNNQDGSPDSLKEDWEAEPPLLYALSLMRNKPDQKYKRGANYKAMAICSYQPYIHIWKPILLLALESYFSNPSISVLASLYNAINSIDISALPRPTHDEKLVLKFSERRDLFEERFLSYEGITNGAPPVTLGLVHRSNGAVPPPQLTMQRSESSGSLTASVKSAGSQPQSFKQRPSDPSIYDESVPQPSQNQRHASRPSVGTLSDLSHNSSSETGEQEVLKNDVGSESKTHLVNGRPITILKSNGSSPSTLSKKPKDTHVFETKVKFGGIELPVRIPLATFDEEVGDYFLIRLIQTFANASIPISTSLHPHLHSSGRDTHPIILLINAILTEKRVIFLGHQTSAGHVASMVHAACALGSGCGTVLRGITGRSFPYANLDSLSYLKNVPGFIAGVVNPIFEFNTHEWDLLFNIDTGKVLISKDIALPTGTSQVTDGSAEGDIGRNLPPPTAAIIGKDSADSAFMDEITAAISAHFGEQVIAARFTEYLQRFIRLASKYEEEKFGTTTIGYTSRGVMGQNTLGSGLLTADGSAASAWSREVEANVGRIEGWRLTKSYQFWKEDFANNLETKPIQGIDVWYQLTRVRLGRKLPPMEVLYISRALAQNTRTDDQVVELLSHTPSHLGGLLPLAFGLLHHAEDVRNNFTELFDNINSHPTGKKFIQSMNTFHRTTYQRLSQDRQATLNGIAEYDPVQVPFPPNTPHPLTRPNFSNGSSYTISSPNLEYAPPLPSSSMAY